MKSSFQYLLPIFFITGIAFANADGWLSRPKSAPFSEFKFLKQGIDRKSGKPAFLKQPSPYFILTGAFDGEETEICYGFSSTSNLSQVDGVACVLKSVNAKTCVQVDYFACSNDGSIRPIK